MGWLDNLDEELDASRVNSQNKTQTDIDNCDNPINAKEDDNQNESGTKKEKDKVAKAIELFADRVTMAGIEDLYKAKTPGEKRLWRLTLIGAIAATIYVCTNVTQQYLSPETIYDHYPMAAYLPAFPNVSICAPLSVNSSLFIHSLIISKRTQSFIDRNHLGLDEIKEFTLEFWRFDEYPRVVKNKAILHVSLEIIKDSIKNMSGGFMDYFMATVATCSQTLTNCSFYDVPFDCCRAAERLMANDRLCFYMDINRIPELRNITLEKTGSPDDPIKLATSGLVVNVSFDRTMASYFDEVAQDGFLFDAGRMLYTTSAPTAIPSGADTVITLSATKQQEITSCLLNNKIPKLKYIDHYDPLGLVAYHERMITRIGRLVGCVAPHLTYFPKENSTLSICPPEMVVFTKTFITETNDGRIFSLTDNRTTAYDESQSSQLEIALFHASLPLCNRWDYKIATASYGYIHLKNQIEWQERESWSRVRILFPTSSFMRRVEQPPPSPYVATCDVGGAMGVYIGVSIISFFQLLFYGIYIACVAAKKRFGNADDGSTEPEATSQSA